MIAAIVVKEETHFPIQNLGFPSSGMTHRPRTSAAFVCAESLEQARELLLGNPVFEAADTVESASAEDLASAASA